MTTGLFPQDSTLKRHAESAAFYKRLTRPETPPTDSTLSRHYAQLKSIRSGTPAPSRSVTPEPAPAKPAQPVATAEPEKRTGLLGLLGRLFGL